MASPNEHIPESERNVDSLIESVNDVGTPFRAMNGRFYCWEFTEAGTQIERDFPAWRNQFPNLIGMQDIEYLGQSCVVALWQQDSSGLAGVRLFWRLINSCRGNHLFNELRDVLHSRPKDEIPATVLKLATREGICFSTDDYRAAVLCGIDTLPREAHDLTIFYRRLVAEGRWFEVFDGVVVGG